MHELPVLAGYLPKVIKKVWTKWYFIDISTVYAKWFWFDHRLYPFMLLFCFCQDNLNNKSQVLS